MLENAARQAILDEEHLKLLSLGYMISSGTSAFFSLFGLMYMFLGFMMGSAFSREVPSPTNPGGPPPQFVGWIFGGIGLAVFLVAVALAGAKLRTAFCLKQRKSRTFCMVVAAITCLGIPYGTVLGIFTFIVLGRDSVMQAFNPRPTAPPPA